MFVVMKDLIGDVFGFVNVFIVRWGFGLRFSYCV